MYRPTRQHSRHAYRARGREELDVLLERLLSRTDGPTENARRPDAREKDPVVGSIAGKESGDHLASVWHRVCIHADNVYNLSLTLYRHICAEFSSGD